MACAWRARYDAAVVAILELMAEDMDAAEQAFREAVRAKMVAKKVGWPKMP
jgi:hypothetical protein